MIIFGTHSGYFIFSGDKIIDLDATLMPAGLL